MSYTVLMIDDNQIVLEALRSTIPWQACGLTLAGTAANGREGCEKIRALRPDIILSDIHMPGMDGLDMMEQMGEELADARVIFITAYEKIEYASRAIKLSAFDFILKPIDNEELLRSLRRAAESLDRERDAARQSVRLEAANRRYRLISAVTAKHPLEGDEVFLGFLGRIPHSYFVLSAESATGLNGPTLQRLDFLQFPPGLETVTAVLDGDLLVFCALPGPDEAWQATARRVAETMVENLIGLTVAVSGLHAGAGELQIACEEARQTLLRHNIYGRHTAVDFYGNLEMNSAKMTRLLELEQAACGLAQQLDSLPEEQLWQQMLERSGGKLRVLRILLMFFCTRTLQEGQRDVLPKAEADLSVYDLIKLDTLEHARGWLAQFLAEQKKKAPPTASSALVRSVLEYVRAHAAEGLVLENVAAMFYVSPNYLSTLIRKETGVTYRQHVINAKIAIAKQMLDDTRMRVEDISYAIGYENYISFYNVFKKVENMSPTEYRLGKSGGA